MINLSKSYTNKLSNYSYIDLFAGIGGFRLAFDSFGAKCVFTSEWDKYAKEVYFDNFNDQPNGDITKIKANEIPRHDIICGGFPCQAFSISGKRKGFDDTRGTLFFDIARIADFHKPKLMILENVKNIRKVDNGMTFQKILDVLEKDLNYSVYHQILVGNDFGVPQKRERVFILCFSKELSVNKYEFVKPNFENLMLQDILEKNVKEKHVFIERDDISLRNIKPEKDLFGNYPNKPIRIGSMNKGGQGERIYHPYGSAITLSAYGGGPGKKTGAYLINDKVRKLTTRECARLMGFPESFKIGKNINQSYTQFGNAVIVNIVQSILKDLIDKKIL
tara:strand:+ start:161 stop:1162 length:1002 start_codon:yes stop_codon:yes gene_type:complete